MSDAHSPHPNECVHCGGPATHRHAITGTYLCCGHSDHDIDAEPIRENHNCEDFYTIARHTRGLECGHRDYPGLGEDPIPCREEGVWKITTSKFPGDPLDEDHPGAPTSTRYCDEHFADRLRDIMGRSEGDLLEAHPRDWIWVD